MMEEKKVRVYYCPCGRSLNCVAVLDYANDEVDADFREAEAEGRKVEILTLEEMYKLPWYCNDVRECPQWGASYDIRGLDKLPQTEIKTDINWDQ